MTGMDMGLGATPGRYGPYADGYRFGGDIASPMAGPGLGAGSILSVFGTLTSMVGSFYSAQSQRYAAKSAAMNAEFEASMANINARAAETHAQDLMEAGQREKAAYTLRAGAAKSANAATTAARGIQAGVGSAAEIAASQDIIKEIDTMAIDMNTARAAAAARMQKVNYRNQGALSAVQANNLRATGKSISPIASAATSLLGGAAMFAGQRAQDARWDAWNRTRG